MHPRKGFCVDYVGSMLGHTVYTMLGSMPLEKFYIYNNRLKLMEMVADGNIIRSLNRSELRRKVLFYLLSIYPYRSYLSEISRAVKSDPSNVKGCLEGLGVRYTNEESLVGLGLVSVEQSKNGFKYFKVNMDFLEDVKSLKTMFNHKKVFAVEIG